MIMVKSESDSTRQIVTLESDDHEVQQPSHVAPDSLRQCISSLERLTQSLTHTSSEVSWLDSFRPTFGHVRFFQLTSAAEGAKDALQSACDVSDATQYVL
jgi:hypothetical protein